MALSGERIRQYSNTTGLGIKVVWEVTNQDPIALKSTINMKVYFLNPNNVSVPRQSDVMGWYKYGATEKSATTKNKGYGAFSDAERLYAEVNFDVPHDSRGENGTAYMGARYYFNAGKNIGGVYQSTQEIALFFAVDLDNIPMASRIESSTFDSSTWEYKLKVSKYSEKYRNKVTYSIGNDQYTEPFDTEWTWSRPSSDWVPAGAMEKEYTVSIQTYIYNEERKEYGAAIGNVVTATFTVTIPSSAAPIVHDGWCSAGNIVDANVNWNQMIKPDGTSNSRVTNNGDGSFTIHVDTISTPVQNKIMADTLSLIKNHKYYYRGMTQNDKVSLRFYNTENNTSMRNNAGLSTARFAPEKDYASIQLYIYIRATDGVYETVRPQLFDLTVMFGAGNEPSKEQFEAMFPKPYYDYCKGVKLFDFLLQSYSTVSLSVDRQLVEPQYGASISSFTAVFEGITYDPETQHLTQIINGSGTIPVIFSVIDSRGLKTSTTVYVDVRRYALPVITNVKYFRVNSRHEEDDVTGNCVAFAAEVGATQGLKVSLDFTINGVVYTIKDEMDPDFFASNPEYMYTDMYKDTSGNPTNVISTTQSYDIRFSARDQVGGTAEYIATISTCEAAFNLKEGGHGAAFGKYAEHDNMLDIGWTQLRLGETVITEAQLQALLALIGQ